MLEPPEGYGSYRGTSVGVFSVRPMVRQLAKGITKNVLALGLVSLLTDVGTEMFYPVLPIFLTSVLGAGVGFVGLVEGTAESTASLLKLFSGWLSDRMRKRKALVLAGYILSGVTRPALALATSAWHVLGARFADRVGKGIRTSPRDALIADSTPDGHRGKAFGLHRAMDHAGAVLGPMLGFLVLSLRPGGYRLLFWLATIPAALSVAVLVLLVSERGPLGTEGKVKLSIRPFDLRFKLYLLVLALFTLGNSSDAFLLLRAKEVGVPTALVPILWVVLHVVKMSASVPGGSLSDRVGRRKVIVAGWTIYATIYLGFALASRPWHIWALMSAYGLYYGLTEGTEKALVSDLVPKELRGTAYGAFNFTVGVMAFPASVVMGFLWGWKGPAAAFGFGAALAAAASVGLMALRLRKE